jgi:hypothetical protein
LASAKRVLAAWRGSMAMDRDDATARIELPATLLALAGEVIE